jgi:hypothetical protein
MAAKKISLSRNAKSFDAKLFDADCQPQAILLHTPEIVSEFSESTGVQILAAQPCTALTVIPGETVKDLPRVKTMTLRCPVGTKETPLYIITPEFGGRPRWFEKRLLTAWAETDGVWEVTLPERGVKDRKLQALAV